MWWNIYTGVTQYFHSLAAYLNKEFYRMTPGKYLGILLFIGLFGYLLMKSGAKGPGSA